MQVGLQYSSEFLIFYQDFTVTNPSRCTLTYCNNLHPCTMKGAATILSLPAWHCCFTPIMYRWKSFQVSILSNWEKKTNKQHRHIQAVGPPMPNLSRVTVSWIWGGGLSYPIIYEHTKHHFLEGLPECKSWARNNNWAWQRKINMDLPLLANTVSTTHASSGRHCSLVLSKCYFLMMWHLCLTYCKCC